MIIQEEAFRISDLEKMIPKIKEKFGDIAIALFNAPEGPMEWYFIEMIAIWEINKQKVLGFCADIAPKTGKEWEGGAVIFRGTLEDRSGMEGEFKAGEYVE